MGIEITSEYSLVRILAGNFFKGLLKGNFVSIVLIGCLAKFVIGCNEIYFFIIYGKLEDHCIGWECKIMPANGCKVIFVIDYNTSVCFINKVAPYWCVAWYVDLAIKYLVC